MSTHGWPTDKHGNEINPGDMIHIDHNGKDRKVTGVTLFMDGKWGINCDEGGGFLFPDAMDEVSVIGRQTEDRKVARVYVGSGHAFRVDSEDLDWKMNSAINSGAWGVIVRELDYGRRVIFRLDSITHIVDGVDSSTMEGC